MANETLLPIHFAPVQGYTEAVYRNAHASVFGGISTYYTPFVRYDKGEFRKKDLREILPENNRVPHLVPQLIASDAAQAEAILALFLEKGYTEADLNFGCPFPLLTKRHYGAGILPYPEEAASILALVTRYPQIRFSIKMRLGFEKPDECLRLLPLLGDLPLSQICLHPRLGIQQYKGSVDLEGFERFYEACPHPLVYNGDLATVADIHQIASRFPKIAGIMIGRGLLANPALALEYRSGQALAPAVLKEKLQALHREVFTSYSQQLEGGDLQLLNKMKPFWEYLLPDAPKKLHKGIIKSSSLEKYNLAVAAFWQGFQE